MSYKTDLAAEVRALAIELMQANNGVRMLAVSALGIGHRLGTALSAARGELTQGTFAALLASVKITAPQAGKLIALAKTYTLDDLRSKSNALRQGMFALGCVPDKERAIHDGDGTVAVSVGLGTCVGHWAKFIHSVEMGRTALDREQAKRQTREMHLWLCRLHGVEP